MTGNGSADGEIERRVLSETIKDRLLEWIVESRLKPGERLIETQIARDFGTSQAPVREAIKALATLGVVEIKPYQGAARSCTVPQRADRRDQGPDRARGHGSPDGGIADHAVGAGDA